MCIYKVNIKIIRGQSSGELRVGTIVVVVVFLLTTTACLIDKAVECDMGHPFLMNCVYMITASVICLSKNSPSEI